jgi:hypothetical protein
MTVELDKDLIITFSSGKSGDGIIGKQGWRREDLPHEDGTHSF